MKRSFPTNIWFSTAHYGSWFHWRRYCSPGKNHKWLWYFHNLHIGGRVKILLKWFKLRSSETVALKTFRLWFAVPPREHAVSRKMISVKSCTCSVFWWPFQCSTTFESSLFQKIIFGLVGKRFLFLMLCKFSVFDGRYLFTIVHCHRDSSASRVCGVFVNKKRSPQLSQIS